MVGVLATLLRIRGHLPLLRGAKIDLSRMTGGTVDHSTRELEEVAALRNELIGHVDSDLLPPFIRDRIDALVIFIDSVYIKWTVPRLVKVFRERLSPMWYAEMCSALPSRFERYTEEGELIEKLCAPLIGGVDWKIIDAFDIDIDEAFSVWTDECESTYEMPEVLTIFQDCPLYDLLLGAYSADDDDRIMDAMSKVEELDKASPAIYEEYAARVMAGEYNVRIRKLHKEG